MAKKLGIFLIIANLLFGLCLYFTPICLRALDENDTIQTIKSSLLDSKPIFTYDDFQYTVDEDNEITLVHYVGNSSDITIPSSIKGKKVIALGSLCFESYTKVNNVVIPDSVTAIGGDCFYRCLTLHTISLPSNLVYIGDNCFSNCEMLKEVIFPKSMKEFGNNIFSDCIQLKDVTIPYDVTELGGTPFTRTSYFNNKILGDGVLKFSSSDGVTFIK